ncbi:MAG: ABC transporter permease subunit, partial [Anaerolineales bacterium]|nr:ABC transporter permease subunit [Anaerolineales bacterium]
MKDPFEFLKKVGFITLSLVVGLILWQALTTYSDIPSFIFPTPFDVWEKFLSVTRDGSLLFHTLVTLQEVLLGLTLGLGAAILTGYLLAKSRTVERVLSPYIVASQSIPIVAIAPLLVIWLGPGIFSKILTSALIVFFPVLVNTIVGIRSVPGELY